MPLKPIQEFGAAYSNASTSEYPSGSYKDETVPGSSRDGSPLVAVTENDRLGFDEALAAEVGMTFTNVPDTAVSSQRLTAHKKLVGKTLSLKIFQSPTDNLTKIETFAGGAGVVYEVRKTSDNSLATIYSDKNGNNEIVQNGTSNVSDNYGAIEFYIVDNSDEMEIKIGGVSSRFKNDVFIQQHMLKLSFNNIYEITSPSDVLEQTFYANVSDTTSIKNLLEITTQNGGVIGFEVSIQSVSSTALVTSKYIGSFTIDDSTSNLEQPVPLALTAHGDNPTLTYSSSILSVNLPNIYCGYYIKVTAVQRPGENYIRFNWL